MDKKNILSMMQYAVWAIFLVPLLVLPNTFIFPFIFPKIIVFRSLTLILLAGYVVLLLSRAREYRLRATPITVSVGVFLVSMVVSTFTGVDWYRSFWDGHERMLGLFTLVHYVLFYLIVTHVFQKEKEWVKLARVFLLAGSAVMLVAFVQKYINIDAVINQGSDRVHGTLGNAIYLSGYGLFLLFLGIYSMLKSNAYSVWYWISGIGSVLGFFGIFWGGTRGTLLGLLVGLVVAVVLYSIFLRGHRQARRILVGVMVSGVFLLGGLVVFRDTAFVQSIPAVGRLVNTDIRGGTANTRFMAWEIAFESWKEYPVFGWGPNNFFYAFNEFYRPEFLGYGFGETWFDNAHNVLMNTLTTQGVVGALSYIALFVVSIVILIRRYREQQISIHVLVLIVSFLVAHFVSLLTVFEDPTSYLYFFFTLALVNSLSIVSTQKNDEGAREVHIAPVGAVVTTVVVLVLVLYATNVNPARANMRTLDALRTLQSDPVTAIQLFEPIEKTSPSPHIDDIRNDFSRSATIILRDPKSMSQPWWNDLFESATHESEKNLALHPRDIRVHIILSDLYLLAFQRTKHIDMVQQAEDVLRTAIEFSPERQQLEYSLASVLQTRGDIDGAILVIEASVDRYDRVGDGWWRLALLYAQKGETERAVGIARTVLERVDIDLFKQAREILQNIVTTYSSTER